MIDRKWAQPNSQTFLIPPIAALIACEVQQGYWADPFAGANSPAQMTNDLDPEKPTTYHCDALDFLGGRLDETYDGVLYDPPYSFRQASEVYKRFGREAFRVTRMDYWAKCRDELARVVRPGGKALCFGWNSGGLGMKRGFVLQRILLVPHGGNRNDTICTVEVKRAAQAVTPLDTCLVPQAPEQGQQGLMLP